mmetsp:Transcript_6136/g.13310  ORF Transcript_6136/g.13310 Transcript_6136/m.13310 type:complete len:207 (+) Transcript_6136:409-1029(+)
MTRSSCRDTIAELAGHGAHGDKLLCSRGVDAHRAVNHSLCDARLDGNSKALHDLRCVVAHHVRPQHTVCVRVHHQLHEGAQGAAAHCVAHGAEGGGEEIQVGMGLESLLLTQAHRRKLWVGEDCRGHSCVVRLCQLALDHTLGHRHALHQRHWGELDAVDDVTHSPDGGDGGAAEVIDHNLALGAHLDTHLLQAQVAGTRGAACCH